MGRAARAAAMVCTSGRLCASACDASLSCSNMKLSRLCRSHLRTFCNALMLFTLLTGQPQNLAMLSWDTSAAGASPAQQDLICLSQHEVSVFPTHILLHFSESLPSSVAHMGRHTRTVKLVSIIKELAIVRDTQFASPINNCMESVVCIGLSILRGRQVANPLSISPISLPDNMR